MNNTPAVALTKQSSQPDIRTYFEAVMRLASGNEQFPVNLDEVWPLVYTEKSKAVAALRKNFIENEDFTTLARKVERQIVHDYFLSVSCLEYFIARKVRPVFEVYRQVFHKVTTPKQLTQSEIVGFQIPKSFSEALRLAAEQADRIETQQKRIEAMRPKELFADAVATSDRSVLVAELAKILQQNGIEMGQNRLFDWLRRHNYLCSKGEYYNQPTQAAMNLGLFELKKTSITKPDGSVLVSCTTKVSGKGQIYFVNKFLGKVA